MNYKEISIENITLPNRPLSNFEIIDAVKALKIKIFRGVYCRNELPSKPKVNECGKIDLDSSDNKGSHWVCYFKKGKTKIYCDSYGLISPQEVVNYLKQPIYYQSEQIQPLNTTCCGHICLYILNELSKDKSKDIKLTFQKIINSLY